MKKASVLAIILISVLFIKFNNVEKISTNSNIQKSKIVALREETGFCIEDNFLMGIEDTREVSSFDLGLDEEYTTIITDKNNTVKTSGYIFTGDKIQIKFDNEVILNPTIVISGDVEADGIINASDYVKIKNHIMEIKDKMIVGDEYLNAADANEDGEISPLDYVRVRNNIMNKSEEKCSITYYSNGGSGLMNAQEVVKDSTTNLYRNNFTREGYNFVGWNTKADGSGITYKDVSKIKIKENTNLYAIWMDNKSYTITYYLGNGKSEEGVTRLGTSTCKYGLDCKLDSFSTFNVTFPLKNNKWSFSGWSTTKTGTNIDYEDGKSFTYEIDDNLELYAIGIREFNYVSGEQPTSLLSTQVQYWNPYSTLDEYVTPIVVPEPINIDWWEFLGYRASNEATEKVAISTTGEQKIAPNEYTVLNYRSIYKKDITIEYSKNSKTAEGSMADQIATVYYNSGYPKNGNNDSGNYSKITLDKYDFTNDGKLFKWWSTKAGSNGGTLYLDKATIEITRDLKLYAQWMKLSDANIVLIGNSKTYRDVSNNKEEKGSVMFELQNMIGNDVTLNRISLGGTDLFVKSCGKAVKLLNEKCKNNNEGSNEECNNKLTDLNNLCVDRRNNLLENPNGDKDLEATTGIIDGWDTSFDNSYDIAILQESAAYIANTLIYNSFRYYDNVNMTIGNLKNKNPNIKIYLREGYGDYDSVEKNQEKNINNWYSYHNKSSNNAYDIAKKLKSEENIDIEIIPDGSILKSYVEILVSNCCSSNDDNCPLEISSNDDNCPLKILKDIYLEKNESSKKHVIRKGAYLLAASIYRAITNQKACTISYRAESGNASLKAEDAKMLLQIVDDYYDNTTNAINGHYCEGYPQ